MYYLLTSLFAIIIGLGLTNTLKPGDSYTHSETTKLYDYTNLNTPDSTLDIFIRMIPTNPISAAAEGDIASARAKGDYVALLQLGASLREIVDAFFLDVKVMSDNPVEKDNRLYMLTQLQALFAEVGDLSYLA